MEQEDRLRLMVPRRWWWKKNKIALIVLMIQLMFGFRNKHTANDNTSGIITLTHILENLPEEQRKKVCVIYFDNEEKGLFGSAFFYKKHRKQIKDKMLINFDCVGDGENIVTMADRRCRKDAEYPLFVDALKQAEVGADVTYLCRKMKFMMFLDTKCREGNIVYLTKAMVEFVEKL